MRRALMIAAAVLTAGLGLAARAEAGVGKQQEARFVSQCKLTHRAPDDPIVKPGQGGKSHIHDFMGNRSTNASSTYTSMRNAGTTCALSADTAGYWVPTLFSNHSSVAPLSLTAYYLTNGKDLRSIKPFPAGLKIVAGNSKATQPQSTAVVWWVCSDHTDRRVATPPTCPHNSRLQLQIAFADCWNGNDLDAPDHASHVAYSAGGRCDAAHPVALPRLVMSMIYPPVDGGSITFASGSVNTAHADFFNTWNQTKLADLVRRCLNYQHDCGVVHD